MAKQKADPCSDGWVPMLKALADPTRLKIVELLLNEPLNVEALAEKLENTPYNVSRHLRILREAGVVESVKEGRHLLSRVAAGFQKRLGRKRILDLGCCQFRFGAGSKT